MTDRSVVRLLSSVVRYAAEGMRGRRPFRGRTADDRRRITVAVAFRPPCCLPEEKQRPSDIRRPSPVFCPPTSRKEVIQPQVPLRLPCYDFTPVADLTVVG
jgi:hypothetical protein